MATKPVGKLRKVEALPTREKAEVVPLFETPPETLSEPLREAKILQPDLPTTDDLLEALKGDGDFLEKLARAADGKRIMGGEGATRRSFPPVKFTAVTTTSYTVNASDLIVGHNIFGVDAGGDTTVKIPSSVPSTKIIVVNNEMTGNNVTVQTIA